MSGSEELALSDESGHPGGLALSNGFKQAVNQENALLLPAFLPDNVVATTRLFTDLKPRYFHLEASKKAARINPVEQPHAKFVFTCAQTSIGLQKYSEAKSTNPGALFDFFELYHSLEQSRTNVMRIQAPTIVLERQIPLTKVEDGASNALRVFQYEISMKNIPGKTPETLIEIVERGLPYDPFFSERGAREHLNQVECEFSGDKNLKVVEAQPAFFLETHYSGAKSSQILELAK